MKFNWNFKTNQKTNQAIKKSLVEYKIKSISEKKLVDFILYSKDVIHRNNLTHGKMVFVLIW